MAKTEAYSSRRLGALTMAAGLIAMEALRFNGGDLSTLAHRSFGTVTPVGDGVRVTIHESRGLEKPMELSWYQKDSKPRNIHLAGHMPVASQIRALVDNGVSTPLPRGPAPT